MSDFVHLKRSGIPAAFVKSVDRPGWDLILDGFIQSNLDVENPEKLHLNYAKRMGALIDSFYAPGKPLSVLHIGAAAMSIPRAIEQTRPNSIQVAVELEEDLIDLVLEKFPLPKEGNIEIVCADAFKYVDANMEANLNRFDVIITDFYIADYLPHREISLGFYHKLKLMMKPDGILIVNAVEDVEKQLDFAQSQLYNMQTIYGGAVAVVDSNHLKEGRKTNILLVGGSHGRLEQLDELVTDNNLPTTLIKSTKAKEWSPTSDSKDIFKFLSETGLTARFRKSNYHPGWDFLLGGVIQSNIDIDNPINLNFDHTRRLGVLINRYLEVKEDASLLHVGAGAMSVVRFVGASYPKAKQLVVDLHSEIIDFVTKEFPLPKDLDASYLFGDAREVIESLTKTSPGGYDLIVVDLHLRSMLPEHLCDLEFYKLLGRLISREGVLLLNILDSSQVSKNNALGDIGIDNFNKVSKIFEKTVVISNPPEDSTENRLFINIVAGAATIVQGLLEGIEKELDAAVVTDTV